MVATSELKEWTADHWETCLGCARQKVMRLIQDKERINQALTELQYKHTQLMHELDKERRKYETEIKQSHDRWLETVKANASLGTLSVSVMGEIDTLKQDLAAVRGDCESFEENFDAIGKKIEALESTIKTAQAEKRI